MNVSVNNTKELKKVLMNAGVDSDYYSIYPDDNFFCDTVCYVCPKNNGWEIGVQERNKKHHVQRFNTEAEACQAFWESFFKKQTHKDD